VLVFLHLQPLTSMLLLPFCGITMSRWRTLTFQISLQQNCSG